MYWIYIGFVAPQISTADLDARSAERKSGDYAARIRDTTGGDHRNPDRIDDLGNKRKCTNLPGDVGRQKHSSMPAGFHTLRDDGVTAVRFEKASFTNCRCR